MLSPKYNIAVQSIARRLFPQGYDVVTGELPFGREDKGMFAWLDAGNRMVVSGDHCDATVFGRGNAEINCAFRAWHDFTHWKLRAGFTFDDENRVFEQQATDLITLYGDNTATQRLIDILHAEIVGQLEYKAVHGDFPDDQVAFVIAYLADPDTAVFQSY